MAADCCDAESFGVKAVPLDGKLNIVFDFCLEKLKGDLFRPNIYNAAAKPFQFVSAFYNSILTFEVCSILEQAADVFATLSVYY